LIKKHLNERRKKAQNYIQRFAKIIKLIYRSARVAFLVKATEKSRAGEKF